RAIRYLHSFPTRRSSDLQLAVRFGGFHPAQDPAAIEAAANYDPVADLENPPGSVFCAHGAGYPVAWDQVPQAMHCPYFVPAVMADRKSTRLNSSHVSISY